MRWRYLEKGGFILLYKRLEQGTYRWSRLESKVKTLDDEAVLADGLLKASEKWLRPVYDALHKQLYRELVLHADEMTLWVLKEPERSSTSKFYMWQSPIGATRNI